MAYDSTENYHYYDNYEEEKAEKFAQAIEALNRVGDDGLCLNKYNAKAPPEDRCEELGILKTAESWYRAFVSGDDNVVQAVHSWLRDPGNWPLYRLCYFWFQKKVRSSEIKHYNRRLFELNDQLFYDIDYQQCMEWLTQRPRSELFRKNMESETFTFDDCSITVELLDIVTEGDQSRHGRWEVTIKVYAWQYEGRLKCQRHRLDPDTDLPGLKFTYLEGPRAETSYLWSREGWDVEVYGVLDWMRDEVCRWILGMDELAHDVDFRGKRG